jgi:hypothetical protein
MDTNQTCKTCKHWKRYSEAFKIEYHGIHAGMCGSEKFIEADSGTKVPVDGLRYWDYEGYSAGFETGENFGCVHWES